MKYIIVIIFGLWSTITLSAQGSIENQQFQISVTKGSINPFQIHVTHKPSGIQRKILPQLRIVYSKSKPDLVSSICDGYGGVVAWKEGSQTNKNIFNQDGETVFASSYTKDGNTYLFYFNYIKYGNISLEISLNEGNSAPSIKMGIIPVYDGYYSIGFTGVDVNDPEEIDFLYQPLTWSWRRFPSECCLTEEAYCTTAATFVNFKGYTEGLAPAPEMIPYRFALSTKWSNKNSNKLGKGFAYSDRVGNSLFGLGIRNSKGEAQPIVFAPLLGGEGSYMKAGQKFNFVLKYILEPGDWIDGTHYVLRNICNYKNERQNATCTLNQTLENMIEFAMDKQFGGWVEEYKAFDYRFDAPGTVKMVSALHALGIALTTGEQRILTNRALPMTEYVMSRQKFLFSIDTTQKMQSPSHVLDGPACEIGELAGLHQLTSGKTPAFSAEANRIFGKTRQLNLQTVTGGASWKDYLAKYRISNNKSDLEEAEKGASDYIENYVKILPTDFKSNSGLKDKQASFQIDFSTNIYDLFELYETTGKKKYLDAVHSGARHLLLWCRSNPIAPDSTILVNQGDSVPGIFIGRREGTTNHDFIPCNVTSQIEQEKVPAWHTSLVGTLPEQHSTYLWGSIMLLPHAAWFLRIATLTGDKLLADAAYNAVLGRYENFPGYYFNSLQTNVYQKYNYPLHKFRDIKYNAMFYNHVWPHIALINDFLVSDAYYRSDGKIDFPSVYAPGYAFLSSKVYGAQTGCIFDQKNIQLWMPIKAIQNSNIAINHLFGIGKNALNLVLMNTSDKEETTTINLNQNKVPFETNKKYQTFYYNVDGGEIKSSIMVNGNIKATIPAHSLIVVQIEGLRIIKEFNVQSKTGNVLDTKKAFVRNQTKDNALGTITGMMINFADDFSNAYIYSNTTEKEIQKAILKYKFGNNIWQYKEDNIYPFEFTLQVNNPKDRIKFTWISERNDGEIVESKEIILGNR